MKKQASGYGPAYGYGGHPTYISPRNAQGGTGGNLPSIFDNPGATRTLILPIRNPPTSGLRLDVKGLSSTGLFLPTAPRERPELGGKRLSSSDSTADRIHQANRLSTSHSTRYTTGDGRLVHRRNSQPMVTFDGTRDKKVIMPIGPVGGAMNRAPPTLDLSTLMRHPPSGCIQDQMGRNLHGTLPPIGAETVDVDSLTEEDSYVTEEDSYVTEEGEEENVFGASEREERRVGVVREEPESSTDADSGTDTDEDDEEFLETGSEAPPSRPGFESDAEKTAQTFQVPFPEVNTSAAFPATLIQDQVQLDTERFSANTTNTGLSPRVNNIVRAFNVHGPLDKGLLRQALNKVVNIHPLLSASFQRYKGKLYAQTSVSGLGQMAVDLETPVIGHEKPDDLILNARRKIFPISTNNDLLATSTNTHTDAEGLANTLSLASMASTEFSNDTSPTTEISPQSTRKRVAFAHIQTDPEAEENAGTTKFAAKHAQLPSLPSMSPKQDRSKSPLIRARLVSKTNSRHILVLSFTRIICDFWSSCLFMQQLTDLYSKLEKDASYRPSLAMRKLENKRQEVVDAYERERKKNSVGGGRRLDAATRLMQKRAQQNPVNRVESEIFVPMYPSKLKFPQVCQREKQLLMMLPRDELLAFWESVVTATIKRERGLNRTKVVPPVRIPAGLGEMAPVSSYKRPQTSRLRPLTASRTRPVTARRQGGGVLGEAGFSREALLGPTTKFHFIKIDDEICEQFKLFLPEYCQSSIHPDDQYRLFALGTYVLLLGKCCRGWGMERHVGGIVEPHTSTGRERAIGSSAQRRRRRNESGVDYVMSARLGSKQLFPDPLQRYKVAGRALGQPQPAAVAIGEGHSPKLRGGRRARLDVGSFLIGVEVSLRHCEPSLTEGLFGPLTNDVAIRVNLSSCETFADLVIALSKSLQSANKHGHLPFAPVVEEVGLINGLPVKFSYLRHHDVIQLANPNNYFYTETAVGVVDQGLSRLGSTCYLTPLNSKLDDSCHLELMLWESYDLNNSLAGGMCYQPQVLKPDLVEALGEEFRRLLCIVADNPSATLLDLAGKIRPPFLSSRSKTRGRRGLNQQLS